MRGMRGEVAGTNIGRASTAACRWFDASVVVCSCPAVAGLTAGGTKVADRSRDRALDHVVVLMFENRSFDNLLGRLYEPGEVRSFEGVTGKDLKNPIPDWAEDGADRKFVPYGVSPTMNTPNPDPGEEYPHVNTQLFGIMDPREPLLSEQMVAPYNAPATRASADDGRVCGRLHQRLHG